VHHRQIAPSRTISMNTRYSTVSSPTPAHTRCAGPNRQAHSRALTPNHAIPAADVGTDVPGITAYELDSTASQLNAPYVGHAGATPA